MGQLHSFWVQNAKIDCFYDKNDFEGIFDRFEVQGFTVWSSRLGKTYNTSIFAYGRFFTYVPRRPSYGVYISQLIRFARVCSHVDDFNTRNKCLTAKLLKQGYRYHKLRKAFSKFYRRHYELISKFNVGLKSLLHQGLSEPELYGD